MKKYLSVEALEAHLLERDWGARQVLGDVLPLFPTSARKQDGSVETEARVSPPEKVIRHILADELFLEKELDNASAEALGHLLEVAEWDVDKIAVLIKAALQHDGVPMRIPPQEVAEALKAKQCS